VRRSGWSASRSKQIRSNPVLGRTVRVEDHGRDRYGRLLGRVFYRHLDVNAEMVSEGAAWVYRKYCRDPELYRLEREAREARVGLWGLPAAQRMPPWECRHPDCQRSPFKRSGPRQAARR
jgi:endonuclease YncB( thermonuclease family)